MRGFVPHSVVEKDSLLLDTLICIRRGDFDKARHDVLSDRCFTDSFLVTNYKEGSKRLGTQNIGAVTDVSRIIGHFAKYLKLCLNAEDLGSLFQDGRELPLASLL